MNFVRHGTEENLDCKIELRENILFVKANNELIQIFLDAMKKFENINLESDVKFESDDSGGSKVFDYKVYSEENFKNS